LSGISGLRRGLGGLFLLSGLLYLAQIIVGFISALDAPGWTRLSFGHFLFTVTAAMLYITLGSARSGLFELQALIDFLAGLLAFLLLFFAVSATLTVFRATPWLSLAPGLFLLYYGLRLRRGRQWRRLEA
jgi:hypothetical protein